MSPFHFESSCARDSGMWWIILQRRGNHIWSSGCGEFFYRESYCDQRVVMTIYGFQIFCDVSSGVGVMPWYVIWTGIPIYGSALAPWVLDWLKCLTLLPLLIWILHSVTYRKFYRAHGTSLIPPLLLSVCSHLGELAVVNMCLAYRSCFYLYRVSIGIWNLDSVQFLFCFCLLLLVA